MTVSAPVLRVEDISVVRSGSLLLDRVSFAARSNEILGVIGPNGAGKTTLFEAIAGFLPTQSGRVERAAPVFYLPDAIRPWADQRARWCLDFFARLFGSARDEEAIELLQLGGVLDQRIDSLSKGEAKRFALALALSTAQPVLLLDEPFDGLDFRQTRIVMDLLRARAAAGRTLILSIHQLVDAERICERFLLLDHGHAIGEGSLAELQATSLEEVFLALE